MENPGVYPLALLSVTTAQANAAQTAITDLDGATAVNLVATFAYGSGGTTCSVVVQTSVDNGTFWLDIARFDFTTASALKWCNNEGLLSKGITTYAPLSSEGVNDGLLGDQLRAVVISTGTYANTTLSVRASVR